MMPYYADNSNTASANYVNALTNARRNSPTIETLGAITEGLANYDQKQKNDKIAELQREALNNQIDLQKNRLGWLDRINASNLEAQKAQTQNVNAGTVLKRLQAESARNENAFGKATLPFRTTLAQEQARAGVGEALLKGTEMSDLLNSVRASDPKRRAEWQNHLNARYGTGGTPLSENERTYYGLLATNDVPNDKRTGMPQTYAQWAFDQKNGAHKLNLTQTNALYKDLAETYNVADKFFTELQNYDPSEYGLIDGNLRKLTGNFLPGAKINQAHMVRLRSFVKEMVDKGVLSNQEQKDAMSLIDGTYEGATSETRRSLADLIITGLKNKLQAFKERGNFENGDTIERMQNEIRRFQSYRDQMNAWDGSTRLRFKDGAGEEKSKPALKDVNEILNAPSSSAPSKKRRPLSDFDR